MPFRLDGNCEFSRSGKAGEPQYRTGMAVLEHPHLLRDLVFDSRYVRRSSRNEFALIGIPTSSTTATGCDKQDFGAMIRQQNTP
jgi:hypothetical protein